MLAMWMSYSKLLYDIHTVLNGFCHHLYLYFEANPSVKFICQGAAICLCCATYSVFNCFFGLSPYFTVNTICLRSKNCCLCKECMAQEKHIPDYNGCRGNDGMTHSLTHILCLKEGRLEGKIKIIRYWSIYWKWLLSQTHPYYKLIL